MRPTTALAASLAALFLAVPLAAAPEKGYLVVARGQGHVSTALDERIAASGGYVKQRWDELGVIVAASANPAFAALMAADPRVHAVSEDVLVPWLSGEPGEPEPILAGEEVRGRSEAGEPVAGSQWNLRQIGADVAAARGYRGAGARVAVLDAGVWVHHPDLEPSVNQALSRSFVPDEPGVEPTSSGFSHGTQVAGTIAAPRSGFGTQGVAPQAEIVAVKVLRSSGGAGAFSWLLSGILYAVAIEADVINLSLGTTVDRIGRAGGNAGPLVAALNRALNHAVASGVLVVCGAGNDALDLAGKAWAIPAQSGAALTVAATAPLGQSDFDRPASYTDYGEAAIDVAAPGGDLASGAREDLILAPGGRATLSGAYQYYFAGGTSLAAAHVSGLAALLVGARGAMPPAQLRSLIERSAIHVGRPGVDPYAGRGRIDVVRALRLEE